MARFLTFLASGIALGSISALIALGIVLLHKAAGILNFAQGDLLTLGAYLGVWFTVERDWPTIPAYAATVVIVFAVGVVIERVGYAPLRRQPMLTVVISTFALALGLRSLILVIFGQDPRALPSPYQGKVWRVGGANIPYQNILIFVATIVVFLLLMLMLHRTPMGRQVRALANDREAALLQGIRVTRLSMLMFGLSASLAAFGGLLVAPRLTVTSEMGFALLLSSFAAVVLGGFDRVGPTVAAAMGIAIAQQMLAGYASFGGFESHKFIEAYPFIILLVILVIRPYGFVKESTSVRY